MSEPIISVDKISVIYNKGKSNEVRSLQDVSTNIYPEEYVIIYGPSGCGKSTLLYSISGLQKPTEGEVMVGGKQLSKMTKAEMVEMHQMTIGMIFQAFYLIPSLTIIDNVCLPKVFRGEKKSDRLEAGVKLLQRFGIAEQADRFESQISGGQKQRVSVARSLINNPGIILADEPVGNLDSQSSENVMQILKELNEIDKKTIILVTHNPDHLHFADRVIFMKDGRVLREEVHKEKRPQGVAQKEAEVNLSDLSDDLKILMRTFKNLSASQIGALLIPFKANQMMSHILSELNEEQLDSANNFLKELLYENIDLNAFKKGLDLDYEKGGAGWNHLRAESFTRRVGDMMSQVKSMGSDQGKALDSIAGYLGNLFKLNVDKESFGHFKEFIKLRLENKLDRIQLQQRLDAPKVLGGMGFHKGTSEKISRELEILILLKYME